MRIKPDFEIVHFEDDYIIVHVGDQIETFNGTVISNEVSALLLEKLKNESTKDELVDLLTSEYDVDVTIAKKDIDVFLEKLKIIGLLND